MNPQEDDPNDESDHDDPYDPWQLAGARSQALAMGGAEQVARQHAASRLTAHERIDGLVDARIGKTKTHFRSQARYWMV